MRHVGVTNMNSRSSRSHLVFMIKLVQELKNDDSALSRKESLLNLVDLAGSERAEATGAKGTRLKEGSMINKSLTLLGQVINSLVKVSRKR